MPGARAGSLATLRRGRSERRARCAASAGARCSPVSATRDLRHSRRRGARRSASSAASRAEARGWMPPSGRCPQLAPAARERGRGASGSGACSTGRRRERRGSRPPRDQPLGRRRPGSPRPRRRRRCRVPPPTLTRAPPAPERPAEARAADPPGIRRLQRQRAQAHRARADPLARAAERGCGQQRRDPDRGADNGRLGARLVPVGGRPDRRRAGDPRARRRARDRS